MVDTNYIDTPTLEVLPCRVQAQGSVYCACCCIMGSSSTLHWLLLGVFFLSRSKGPCRVYCMWASSVTLPAWWMKDWQTVQTTCKWVASRCWVNVNKLSDNVKTLGFVCVWWGRGLGTGEESMVGLFISWILRIHPAWVKAATTFFLLLYRMLGMLLLSDVTWHSSDSRLGVGMETLRW